MRAHSALQARTHSPRAQTARYQVLSVAVSCCQLLSVAVSCCQVLSVAVSCYQLLSVAISCCQVLSVAMSCYELLSVAVSCCQLLSVAVTASAHSPHAHSARERVASWWRAHTARSQHPPDAGTKDPRNHGHQRDGIPDHLGTPRLKGVEHVARRRRLRRAAQGEEGAGGSARH